MAAGRAGVPNPQTPAVCFGRKKKNAYEKFKYPAKL
jgi:hypothetical protein